MGAALSPAAGPVLVPDEPTCRQACCLTPACDGYSFDAGALRIDAHRHTDAMSTCFLLVNVSQLVPSNTMVSGLRESVLL